MSDDKDLIAEYYADKEAKQKAELDAHLAAGKPIGTFEPKNLID